jgi:hypothetical protein
MLPAEPTLLQARTQQSQTLPAQLVDVGLQQVAEYQLLELQETLATSPERQSLTVQVAAAVRGAEQLVPVDQPEVAPVAAQVLPVLRELLILDLAAVVVEMVAQVVEPADPE